MWLQHCRSLRVLELRDNKIADAGCAALCDAVCEFIEEVDLGFNKVTVLPLHWQLHGGNVRFRLSFNPMRSPPSAAAEGSDKLRAYLTDLRAGHVPCERMRLLVLG